MDMVSTVISWAFFGLIAGAIARLLTPGPQRMGCLSTILLGVAGSLVGGFLSFLFFGGKPLQASGWIMSIIGAVIVLLIAASTRRSRF